MSMTQLPWPNDHSDDHPDQPWNYWRDPDVDDSLAERKAAWLAKREPRRLEATDYYTITGRGLVFSMKEPDPPLELGEEIEIAMPFKGTVCGLERHPTADSPKPGRPVGVQMNFADEDG